MRNLILLGALCVLAFTTITAVHATNLFACDGVCNSARYYCTAACHKEALRPVCAQACQDGEQACLVTCTIGASAVSSDEEVAAAVPTSVTPSSSIRHRIHSAKEKKHHQRYAPPNDPCNRLDPWFCASCQMGGGQCHFLNSTCQVCVPTSASSTGPATPAEVAPSTHVKKDNDDQCVQDCMTNGANCVVRCQIGCSQLPGGSCSCASCTNQQAQCISACDE